MKDNKSIKKDIIKGTKVSREAIYYAALFTLGAIVSTVLAFIGKANENKGLLIYALVLLPIFVTAALVAARFICVSVGTVCKKGDVLVIKTYFMTKRYNISEIKKLSVVQHKDGEITEIKFDYRENTAKYTFNNMTKDEVTRLKRATLKK